MNWTKLLKDHWLAILIISLGTFLRFYQLDQLGIFFGDSARDLLVASDALEKGSLPLLGIPSSVPRFRQGPISLWLVMLIFSVFSNLTMAAFLVYALIGSLSLIVLYEFCLNYFSQPVAVVALFLMALSPMAIAHSRMVYHIVPIPLMVVLYLWLLIRLQQKKPLAVFWGGLGFALLFQFELSLFPLILGVGYAFWQSPQKLTKKQLFELVVGLALGLLPQLWYDLTHGWQQLGGFGLWLGYRIIAVFMPGSHTVSVASLTTTLHQFWLFWGRIWSLDNRYTNSAMFGLLGVILVRFLRKRKKKQVQKKKLPFAERLVFFLTAILTLGYFLHGTPSEAYFPPYLVLLPLLIAIGIGYLQPNWQRLSYLLLSLVTIVNLGGIFKHNFFVSNSQAYTYGPSTGEQQAIAKLIANQSQQNYLLITHDPNGKFATHFDNMRWWLKSHSLDEDQTSQSVFYLEPKGTIPTLKGTDTTALIKREYPSLDVYFFEKKQPDGRK